MFQLLNVVYIFPRVLFWTLSRPFSNLVLTFNITCFVFIKKKTVSPMNTHRRTCNVKIHDVLFLLLFSLF